MNEDIAKALLSLEAMLVQQNQRIADLEFQVRQAHRDLAKTQERVGIQADNINQVVERHNSLVTSIGKASWLGRVK